LITHKARKLIVILNDSREGNSSNICLSVIFMEISSKTNKNHFLIRVPS